MTMEQSWIDADWESDQGLFKNITNSPPVGSKHQPPG
jgi:hypothetical protein